MRHLTEIGVIVHLDLPFDEIQRRVTNLYTRGVVMEKGQTLNNLYENRQPLYEKYAELTVNCSDKTHEQIVEEIVLALNR
jgi:shikimate kinase